MGRYKLIESPEKMWQLFCDYKAKAKSSPILVQDFVGKDGTEVKRQRERPLTMEGFECFVMDNTEITYPNLIAYFKGEGSYSDFLSICSRIRREIRQDQISGGMAGIYNPSITQRLNNLVEKTDTKTEGIQKITIERVSQDKDQTGT
jgi:hypothetical protein